MIAKTLAEEAAWTFAKENGIDLVTINPGFVIGPLIQPTLTFSLEGVFEDHTWYFLATNEDYMYCVSFYINSKYSSMISISYDKLKS